MTEPQAQQREVLRGQFLHDVLEEGVILLNWQPDPSVDYNEPLTASQTRKQIEGDCYIFGCRLLLTGLAVPGFTIGTDRDGLNRIAVRCPGMRHPDCRFNLNHWLLPITPRKVREDD